VCVSFPRLLWILGMNKFSNPGGGEIGRRPRPQSSFFLGWSGSSPPACARAVVALESEL
jgi:hypothetical protein